MKKDSYKVIGVMSGTSLDGIDLVYCELTFDEKWSYKIFSAHTYEYNAYWRTLLRDAIGESAEVVSGLDERYTEYLAEVIHKFKKDFEIKDVDYVCSHGHTVFHQPHQGLTLQIGNLPKIASLIGNTVICNFRVQDVQLGGQGAPLVPIGDQLLFGKYAYCLNLGGFANISSEVNGARIAYDVCPVNIVLNNFAEKLGLPFDDKGALARDGVLNTSLLERLNALPFYKQNYPKSLGLEWVKQQVFSLFEEYDLKEVDAMHTFVVHAAMQIGEVLKRNGEVLVTGGGVFNDFLMEEIQQRTPVEVIKPERELIMFKEALVFAFLGVLRVRNEVNCLQTVTGASQNHSSGYIYKA